MIDKDGVFLDEIERLLHDAWIQGDVTNEFRNHFIATLTAERDWL